MNDTINHAITVHDVLWAGGGVLGIMALLAVVLGIIAIINPFSSGH